MRLPLTPVPVDLPCVNLLLMSNLFKPILDD